MAVAAKSHSNHGCSSINGVESWSDYEIRYDFEIQGKGDVFLFDAKYYLMSQ